MKTHTIKSLLELSEKHNKNILEVYPIWDLFCDKLYAKRIRKNEKGSLLNDSSIEQKSMEYSDRYFYYENKGMLGRLLGRRE